MSNIWRKGPNDSKNYKFDFAPLRNSAPGADSDWLDSAASPQETISSYTLTSESPGLTIAADSLTDSASSVTVKLSGGQLGGIYTITCSIVTSTGQTESRKATVIMVDK